MNSLTSVAALLAAAVLIVPLFRRAGLGTVLGYLATGVLIGRFGTGLIDDPEELLHLAEIGIVLLLFVIGLELQPSRLWALRRQVFGLGLLQLVGCGATIAGVAMALGASPLSAFVIGWTLALSSTALVLPTLAERKELTTRYGRESFAILLFQDLSVIVLLAILPLLGVGSAKAGQRPYVGLLVLVAVALVGRTVLGWLFRYVARFGSREVFTAAALLCALGLALLMQAAGLSMSLGAFVAGVLLADSEFRHELEASIAPFETLLLGLFFIAVGLSIDLGLLVRAPLHVLGITVGLLALKVAVLYLLRRAFAGGADTARPLAFALAQGGEFAFVVFTMLEQGALVPQGLLDELNLAVALSMAFAPLFFLANDRLARMASGKQERVFDEIADDANAVVIAGFGRVGQVVARLLLARGLPFTALDSDAAQVETVRRFGMKVYYGDASQLALLHAAKVDKARVFVLAIDDVEASLRTAELVRRHFPHVKLVARARNRFHAYRLLDLGVDVQFRETLRSSIDMGSAVLGELGLGTPEIEGMVARFVEHDQRLLLRQHAVWHDEQALVQTSKDARAELVSIFEEEQISAGQGKLSESAAERSST
jgi:monovalent cation:proton antiporter-2 (CPA2) family protein